MSKGSYHNYARVGYKVYALTWKNLIDHFNKVFNLFIANQLIKQVELC